MAMKFNPAQNKPNSGSGQMPAGVYAAAIIDHRDGNDGVLRKTAKSGNEMLNLVFIILDPQYKGRMCWHNAVLTDNMMWMWGQLYWAVEPNENNHREFDLESDYDVHKNFFYKPHKIEVYYEDWNGKPQMRIRQFSAIQDDQEFNQAMDVLESLLNEGKAGDGPMTEEQTPPPPPPRQTQSRGRQSQSRGSYSSPVPPPPDDEDVPY